MSDKTVNFQIKTKDLSELESILSSKNFRSLNIQQKLDFFREIDPQSSKPWFLSFVAQSPEHIRMLLSHDSVITGGHNFCFELVTIQDKNKLGILEIATKKPSTESLKEILSSKIFKEILSPNELYKTLIQDNISGISNFALVTARSPEHLQIILESNLLDKISESQALILLNLPISEDESINSIWFSVLKGKEYWYPLFNSNIINKLNDSEVSSLLTAKYENNNDETPLEYMVSHYSENELTLFLGSRIFKKLNLEVYQQYTLKNGNDLTVLDIALTKSPASFKALLECDKCFNILTEDQRLEILTSPDISSLPLVYKAMVIGDNYENIILNSEALLDMSPKHRYDLLDVALHSNINVIDQETPDPEIVQVPERLAALVNSTLFKSLDHDKQLALLGQQAEVDE
ncbi:MAG: hypothetical protein WBJ81_00205 [Rickettsiales bacterium]